MLLYTDVKVSPSRWGRKLEKYCFEVQYGRGYYENVYRIKMLCICEVEWNVPGQIWWRSLVLQVQSFGDLFTN